VYNIVLCNESLPDFNHDLIPWSYRYVYYATITLHGITRSKELVDSFYKLVMGISYSNVLFLRIFGQCMILNSALCVLKRLLRENQASVSSTGAVLEGFLRFPETTQDFPSMLGAPLFGHNVSRGIHSGLNSGVNWPLFQLLGNAVKTFFFFWSPRRKIGDLRKNLCCSVTRNSVRRPHRTHLRQTGCLETTQQNL